MKKTVIDWLAEKIFSEATFIAVANNEDELAIEVSVIKRILKQAKEMEEEQHQETLEEAAETYANYWEEIHPELSSEDMTPIAISKLDFIYGAKWHAERSYSEEDVNEIMAEAWNSCEDNEGETFTEVRKRILEQFKNK